MLIVVPQRSCLSASGKGIAVRYFSSDYREAREKFLEASRDAGAGIASFQNPGRDPEGNPLFTDVALLGSEDARKTLVLGAGTHGVEGLTGSGLQTGLLRDGIGSHRVADLSIVMIHAINPYGFAHLRRVNEDNVDLNRNFIDHSKPYPGNPGYEALADAISPESMSPWSSVATGARLLWYGVRNGKDALFKAVSGGQYSHPEGLFYGGRFETWSNRTIRSIAERHLARAEHIVIVDFHTGLGPYGNAEIIVSVPETSPAYRRAAAIWGVGSLRSTTSGESVSVHLSGPIKAAFPEMLPDAEVTAVSLEFGTSPVRQVIGALRAENWLHHHGRQDHPKAKSIREEFLRVFYPDANDWRELIWVQGKQVTEQALNWVKALGGAVQ